MANHGKAENLANRENLESAEDVLIPVGRAAEILGMSEDSVRDYCDAGHLWFRRFPGIGTRQAGKRKLSLADVLRFKESSTFRPTVSVGSDPSLHSQS